MDDHGYFGATTRRTLLSASLMLLLAGCSSAVEPAGAGAGAGAGTSKLDEIIRRGRVRVVVLDTSPPTGYIDAQGRLVGFEVDLARLIAKYLFGDPAKVDLVVTSSDGRFPAVLSGKADFGLASATPYPERAARGLAFTRPYATSSIAVLVPPASRARAVADLNRSGVRLAQLGLGPMIERSRKLLPKATPLNFDRASAAVLALKTGQADALQIDISQARYYAARRPADFRILTDHFGGDSNWSIFLKQGDFPFWLFLETTVRELRCGSRNDDYIDLYRRYFHANPRIVCAE